MRINKGENSAPHKNTYSKVEETAGNDDEGSGKIWQSWYPSNADWYNATLQWSPQGSSEPGYPPDRGVNIHNTG